MSSCPTQISIDSSVPETLHENIYRLRRLLRQTSLFLRFPLFSFLSFVWLGRAQFCFWVGQASNRRVDKGSKGNDRRITICSAFFFFGFFLLSILSFSSSFLFFSFTQYQEGRVPLTETDREWDSWNTERGAAISKREICLSQRHDDSNQDLFSPEGCLLDISHGPCTCLFSPLFSAVKQRTNLLVILIISLVNMGVLVLRVIRKGHESRD